MRLLDNLHAVCWCRGEVPNVRKLTLRISAGVQELCVAPANFREEGVIAPKSREEEEIG